MARAAISFSLASNSPLMAELGALPDGADSASVTALVRSPADPLFQIFQQPAAK